MWIEHWNFIYLWSNIRITTALSIKSSWTAEKFKFHRGFFLGKNGTIYSSNLKYLFWKVFSYLFTFFENRSINVLKQPSFLWLEPFACVRCLKTVSEHWAMPDLRDTRIQWILNSAKETLPMLQCMYFHKDTQVTRRFLLYYTFIFIYVCMWTYK